MSSPSDIASVTEYVPAHERSSLIKLINCWYMHRQSSLISLVLIKIRLVFGLLYNTLFRHIVEEHLPVFELQLFSETHIIFLLKYNKYAIFVQFIHSKQTNN